MRIISLCLIIFVYVNSFAQQYNFISYGVKEGLAQSQVTDICQDKLGNLWLGTETGLSKFNGLSFENYSVDDGLADNEIDHIMVSHDDKVWVVTANGLSLFDNQNGFKSYYFKESQYVRDVTEYNDTIYLLSNNGIVKFNGLEFEEVVSPVEDLRLRALDHMGDSVLFCATNSGLYILDIDTLVHFEIEASNEFIISDFKIFENQINLSTFNEGIISFEYPLDREDSNAIKRYPIDLIPLRSIYVDEEGILGASDFGMIEVIDGVEKFYDQSNGLTINAIRKVSKDNEGNIWIATSGKGLLKFSGKSIMSYGIKEGLTSDIVMTIAQYKSGEFVFGTYDKGVNVFSDHLLGSFDNNNGLKRNSVWGTFIDDEDNCWLGTSGGVCCLKGNELLNTDHIDDITGRIRTIHQNGNELYFGGSSGLWSYNKTSKELEHLLQDRTYDIRKIAFSKDKIFLGTINGLYWHDLKSTNKDYNHLELPEENVNTLCIDSHENLWVGTTNGLYIISPDLKTKVFDLDNSSYKAKNIMGIITDRSDRIWISTTNGAYLLSNQNPFEKDPITFHYTTSEGMVDMECNLNALYEDLQGNIWIGTSSGLVQINPLLNSSLFSYQLPQLSITGIRLFKENFDFNEYETQGMKASGVPEEIRFPFKKNHVTFDFIGINNKNPESVYYKYRLVGAEEDWSAVSTENSANYSFISPGTYQFQVMAANKNLEWTEPVELTLIISPPYWQTWWFISLILIGVMIIIYYLLRLRLKDVRQKKDNERLVYENKLRNLEQRSLNASMNRHFIFNSLNSIQYFINSSDKKSANKFLSNFAQLIRKNLDSSTQPNFLVSLNEELERINLYLTLEKMRFNEKFDYEVSVEDSIDEEMINVPSMILQPFVENSIIHGVLPKEGKGSIKVSIKEENDSIIFEVEDNGVGIDDSLNQKDNFNGDHKSQGMEITANRIELLRKINGDKLMIIGPFQVNNKDGKSGGTKVIIKLPIY